MTIPASLGELDLEDTSIETLALNCVTSDCALMNLTISDSLRRLPDLDEVKSTIRRYIISGTSQLTNQSTMQITLLEGMLNLETFRMENTVAKPFPLVATVAHISELYISNTSLSDADHSIQDGIHAMFNLTILECKFNHLTNFPNLHSSLATITKILLQYNNIKYIPADAIQDMPSLKLLDLTGNKITRLKGLSIENLPNLVSVKLYEQAIVCDCLMFWMADVQYYSKIKMRCAAPPNMADRNPNVIPAEDYKCAGIT